jgi:hypothetical protein
MPAIDEDAQRNKPKVDDRIIIVNDDGTKTLRAASARHVMLHIYMCLRDGEKELFTHQVLSESAKTAFADSGRTSDEAFEMLMVMRNDIVDLFNTMPGGERSPGVAVYPGDGKSLRLVAPRGAQSSLRLIGMEMDYEMGNWRLRWFIPANGTNALPKVATREKAAPEPVPPRRKGWISDALEPLADK